jgi:hypothetical protein
MRATACLALLIAGALALFSATTKAEGYRALTVSSMSYHFDRSIDHNERNAGLGFETSWTKELTLTAGFYRNSSTRPNAISTYAAVAYKPLVIGPVRAGMMFGAVTGYQAAAVLPAIAAVASFDGRDSGLNVYLLPAVRERAIGAIGVQVKRRF